MLTLCQSVTLPFVAISIGVAPITQLTHLRNKNSNIQGRSPDVVKKRFSMPSGNNEELLLNERIRSPWEQILSFKRSSYFIGFSK